MRDIKVGMLVKMRDCLKNDPYWKLYVGKTFMIRIIEKNFINLISKSNQKIDPREAMVEISEFWNYFKSIDLEQMEFDFGIHI